MKYIFEYGNQKALEDIYFHDCVYEGFSYDTVNRKSASSWFRNGRKRGISCASELWW